jgi:zinc protease
MLQSGIRRARHSIMGLLMLALAPSVLAAETAQRATSFNLANGIQVVVVPDHRAPVVTHMVWYRVGAADELPGKSGIAHFLEHLMFKSTDKIPMGEFSKIVARLGGQDNAFTSQDTTAYFQRVAKERLQDMMEMEADRMVNLRLTEKEVLTERDVILEERRSRIENNPSAILDEQMEAALYQSHPYGIPVIGWEHEIAALTPDDAMAHYKRYYAPNNAILVVSGDVTVDEVRRLAEATYGKIPANPAVGTTRFRPSEPPHRAARRVALEDPRAGKPSWHRSYLAPSYTTAGKGEAEALELLMKIVADGPTSRIYKKLVVEAGAASSAGGWYSGSGRDSGKIGLYAVAADGSSLDRIETLVGEMLAEVVANGVSEAELKRAKASLVADFVYESDSQATLARRYGFGLTAGRTIPEIEGWPEAIGKVDLESIKQVARKHLDIRNSVTGTLTPAPSAGAAVGGTPAKSRT